MRQRLALAGQDPDEVMGESMPPLQAGPSPTAAFERSKVLQRQTLEKQAQQRRN